MMTAGQKRDANARNAGLLAASLTTVAGAIWLVERLFANYPGDAGPVVGPGAWTKVAYGAWAGVIIVGASALLGAAVWLFTRIWQSRHRTSR
jgi:tetrahydromethanopterin S-methyltransferase subunit B